MLHATIKAIYTADINGVIDDYGYCISFKNGADETIKDLSPSAVLKKDTLNALNRNGYVLTEFEPFPKFKNDSLFPHNYDESPKIVINHLGEAQQVVVIGELTKEYSADVSDYTPYFDIIPDLRIIKSVQQLQKIQEGNAAEAAKATQGEVDKFSAVISQRATDSDGTNKPNQTSSEDLVTVTAEAQTPAPTPVPEPTTQSTPVATAVKTEESTNKVKGIKEVPKEYPYPNVTPSTEYSYNYIVPSELDQEEIEKFRHQGYPVRESNADIREHFGVKLITTQEEYRRYLTDFVDGKINWETDARALLNLNWFLDPSLLHKSIFAFAGDILLQRYIIAKTKKWTLTNIKKLISGLESVMGIDVGSDLFVLITLYFGQSPLEGYDNVHYRTFVEVVNKSVNRNGLTRFVLKKDGKIDLTGFKRGSDYKVIEEHEDYAVVSYNDFNRVLALQHSVKDHGTVIEVGNNGSITVTYKKPSSLAELDIQNPIKFNNYFDIRSEIDPIVSLPLPDENGLFNGWDEESFIFKSRIDRKITKLTDLSYNRNEFDVFYNAGFSVKDMNTLLLRGNPSNKKGRDLLLSKGLPESMVNEIASKVYISESIMNALLSNYDITEKNIYDVIASSLSFDKGYYEAATDDQEIPQEFYESLPKGMYTDSDLSFIYAMVTCQITTNEGGAALTADNLRSQYLKVSMLANAAMSDGLVTPREILEELDRVSETYEPVSFKTGVKIDWKVEGIAFYNHLDLMEKAIVRQRLYISQAHAEITHVISNHTNTDLIGVRYNLTVPNEPSLSGVYAESFHALRQSVEMTKIMCTNGVITSTGFIPNPGIAIPVMGAVEAFNQINGKEIKFLATSINDPISIYPYFTKRFVDAVSEFSKTNKFIEPITPAELLFGLSDERKKITAGELDPETVDFPEVPSQITSEYYNVATDKNDSSQSHVPSKPEVETEQGSVTPVREPSAPVTPTPEPEPKQQHEEGSVTVVRQPETTPASEPKVNNEFAEFDAINNPKAPYVAEVKEVVSNSLTDSELSPQKAIGFVIRFTQVSDNTVYSIVESLPDFHELIREGKMYCSNMKFTKTKIEPNISVPYISVLSDRLANARGVTKSPEIKTDLTSYMQGLRFVLKGLKEQVASGTSSASIIDSLARIVPSNPVTIAKSVLGETEDETLLSKEDLMRYLGITDIISADANVVDLSQARKDSQSILDRYLSVQEELRKLHDQYVKQPATYQIAGFYHSGFYIKQFVESVSVFPEDRNSDQLASEAIRAQIGLVKLPFGGYVTKLVDGTYVLMDSSLNPLG